jgi:hypothetical protein
MIVGLEGMYLSIAIATIAKYLTTSKELVDVLL